MRVHTLRQYDALRFSTVLTDEQLNSPAESRISKMWSHYRSRWLNRPRQRSFWDRRPGDTGSAVIVTYAHEFTGTEPKQHKEKD